MKLRKFVVCHLDPNVIVLAHEVDVVSERRSRLACHVVFDSLPTDERRKTLAHLTLMLKSDLTPTTRFFSSGVRRQLDTRGKMRELFVQVGFALGCEVRDWMDPGADFDDGSSERRCRVGGNHNKVMLDAFSRGVTEDFGDLRRRLGLRPGLLMFALSPVCRRSVKWSPVVYGERKLTSDDTDNSCVLFLRCPRRLDHSLCSFEA